MLAPALYQVKLEDHGSPREMGSCEFPLWPCPTCEHGVLQLPTRLIRFASAAGMAAEIENDPHAQFYNHGEFCAILSCANAPCRQGVVVVGHYSISTPDGQWASYDFPVVTTFIVSGIHPAFSLIHVPNQLPQAILDPLRESFSLYWGHPQACAASIRTTVEGIAEHLGQPKEVNGKYIPLVIRLKNLTPGYPILAKVASAIKDFGNNGAHGNTVEREKLIAAYELIEIELRVLFDDTNSRRDILIGQLKT